MDKRFALFAIILLSIFLISCSSQKETDKIDNSQTTKNEMFEITGKILVVGNEPFTKLSVFTNDTTGYILELSEKDKKELKLNQGEIYNITYSKRTKTHEGESIKVEKIEKKK